MTADRYVRKDAIKQAVEGREGQVLDALGIDWRRGGHIRCPYPDHDDKDPSWRWDERARKAYCTCTQPKSASIFDIAMKVHRLADFEAAKIVVAELLGRDDLIQTKNGGGQFQDAYSLLNAPAERRDDSLAITYLAHRLGVPAEDVPVPSTPIVGLKALAYFDPPPQGSRVKWKSIGDFPCAVFGTVAADGRRHAHRIYVAPGGAGKADLGQLNGRPRNPKKSARVIGDESTAGCAVLWGVTSAPHIVTSEGIETGAAVAIAFKKEVAAGEVMVAAAISAGGIEAFLTYPATTRVTVAADRDEATKSDGKPGSRTGEKAARAFALKHYTKIAVDIALPGNAGETADWLDILQRDGVEAVRDGIRAAIGFEPTQDELDGAAETARRQSEIDKVSEVYPLPTMQALKLTYAYTADGRVLVHKLVKGQKNPVTGRTETELTPISTPFGIPARLRFIDQQDEYGLRVRVEGMNGQPRPLDFDRAGLAKMAAADIRSMLYAAGLRTFDDGEQIAIAALKAADPAAEIVAVRRRGWHRIAGHPDPIFVAPDGSVYGTTDNLQLELSAAMRMPPEIARAGDFDGWRAAVGTAVSVADCQHWTLGLLAGFAGSLAGLADLPTCGINLSGQSSSGKSLAQEIAVSIWSKPDLTATGSLLQSARNTDNSLEGQAARATGTILVLDELALVAGKVLSKTIYMIASGVGKSRMRADATLRTPYSWVTFALFSNEVGLAEKIRDDGGEWLPGMAARFADVDVDGVNRQVGRATLDAIHAIRRHYGHAGPMFVQGLIEAGRHRDPASLRQLVNAAMEKLAGAKADSATKRAAQPFALLHMAGTLAQAFGVLPAQTDVAGTVRWAWQRFGQSAEAAALDPGERAIENIQLWLIERWDISVKDAGSGGPGYREAAAWYDETAVYIPKGRLHEAAGKALKEPRIAALLRDRNLLARRLEPDRLYLKWTPGIGPIKSYALSREAFGRNQKLADLKAHEGGRDGD